MSKTIKGYPVIIGPEDVRYRARQNVVLELGYFVGNLGRSNVLMDYPPSIFGYYDSYI